MPPTQPWMPDWRKMMDEAPEIELAPGKGWVYLIADSHLGDVLAPTGQFFQMLESLPNARMVVFLGDLFKVWLAVPKYWDRHMREILAGFENLRAAGVSILFVAGNREFLLPRGPEETARQQLPFDHIIHGACTLRWGSRRWGMTHGDVVNRKDRRHLKWRRIAHSRWFETIFRLMPGRLARSIAHRLERAMAHTNMDIKVQYPIGEIQAFAQAVMGDLDGFFVGHFHRDEVISLPRGKGKLRIVPDWHSRKIVLRLEQSGKVTRLDFNPHLASQTSAANQ